MMIKLQKTNNPRPSIHDAKTLKRDCGIIAENGSFMLENPDEVMKQALKKHKNTLVELLENTNK